ncbi:MAG: HlyD family efflux transporter periplasmic adaptor subunit [Anaerolineae bacterium]|nr:HlyD family efflux transporter periplasmic adaptor subunit [Anaerolineae bacterium]
MMKQRLFALLLLLTAVLLGCQNGPEPPTPDATVEAEISATATAVAAIPTPERQEGVTILAEGQIVASNPELVLSFSTSGELLDVYVQPGDVVAAGDLLAELDTAELDRQLLTAQTNLTSAQIQLANAEQDLEDNLAQAQLNLERIQVQLNQNYAGGTEAGLISASISLSRAQQRVADAAYEYQKAVDRHWEPPEIAENYARFLQQAEEDLIIAEAQYNDTVNSGNSSAYTAQSLQIDQELAEQAIAKLQRGVSPLLALEIERAHLAIADIERQLSEVQLFAPIAGEVLAFAAYPAPGTMVGAGTPFVTLFDTAALEFHTSNLSERDLAQIEPGQAVSIVLKAYPDTPLTGTVLRIGPQATGLVGDAATFPVIIELDAAELDLRPGMTGRAEVSGGR